MSIIKQQAAAVSIEDRDRDRDSSNNNSNNNDSTSGNNNYNSSDRDILNTNSSSSADNQNLIVLQNKYLFCLWYFNREIIQYKTNNSDNYIFCIDYYFDTINSKYYYIYQNKNKNSICKLVYLQSRFIVVL